MDTKHPINASFATNQCCTSKLSLGVGVRIVVWSALNKSPDEKAKCGNKQCRNAGKQIADSRNHGVVVAIQQHLRNKSEQAQSDDSAHKRSVGSAPKAKNAGKCHIKH